MKNKILVSCVIVPIFIIAILFLPLVTQVLAGLVILRSLWEFYGILERSNHPTFKWSGIAFSAVYLYSCATAQWSILAPLGILGFLSLFLLQALDKENKDGLSKIGFTSFGFVYITILGSFFYYLYNDHPNMAISGANLLLAVLFISKFTDAAANFGGKAYGKTKLIPRISPNKSWEGLGFGYLGALIPTLFLCFSDAFSFKHAIILGLIIATFSVFGDLAESMFKREVNEKDAANDIPGFGGALDITDSLLFALPAAYWYSVYAGIIPQ